MGHIFKRINTTSFIVALARPQQGSVQLLENKSCPAKVHIVELHGMAAFFTTLPWGLPTRLPSHQDAAAEDASLC